MNPLWLVGIVPISVAAGMFLLCALQKINARVAARLSQEMNESDVREAEEAYIANL